jgi:pimeloyl-ACP methyl ester carboxylesterase
MDITIPTLGYEIAAQRWGDPEGIPVLAMHGWLDNSASFAPMAPHIKGIDLVAVDSPGCGRSSHGPPGRIIHLVDEMFVMFEVARELGWDKFHVLGHSRGGLLAVRMAAAAPDSISSLVLLDSLGGLSNAPEDNVIHMRKSLKRYLAYQKRVPSVFPSIEVAAVARQHDSQLSIESARLLAERATRKVEGGIEWIFDRRLLHYTSPMYHVEEQIQALIAAVQAPTCLVIASEGWGPHDAFHCNRIEKLRDKKQHEVPGGHHVHMENPEPIADIVNAFIRSV